MMHTAVCGIAKRAGAGSRLPRHIASPATARMLSTINMQSSHFFRPRPLAQGLAALPGSTRNISLSSSRPAPTTPSNPAAVEETIPSELAAQSPASDAANAVSENLSQASSVVPSDASIVSDASSTLAETLSSVPVDALTSIAPLHYGDLTAAGLTSFWPPGLCVWGLETLQVATGMPWFWTIVVGTFAARFVLIPFAASSMSNAAKLAEHQPELQAVQAQVKAAFESKNQFEMQRAALAQRALFKRIGVNPMKNFIPMFVQLPVTIGLFLGVKRMCDLPVEQLKVSGVSFLTDLTVPDPTWVLPILGAVVMNLQITLSARDMATSEFVPHMINIFRVLSVVGTAWIGYFPAGTQLTILVGTIALGIQTLLFRVPTFRRLFGLPLSPKNVGNKTVSFVDSLKYAREWWRKQAREAREQASAKDTIQTITRKRK